MSELTPYKLQLRRAKSTQWTATNPVLKIREPAIETDTGKFKIGNGTTPWNSLPYFADEEEFIDIIRELGPVGGPFEFIGADVVMVDTMLSGILSTLALFEAIITDKVFLTEVKSAIYAYVWNGSTYIPANNGTVPDGVMRIFYGPENPIDHGFIMTNGDIRMVV